MISRIRLTEAAKICGLPASALRRERDKGTLAVSRLAGKDWTTIEAIERMFELCREQEKAPACGFAPRHQIGEPSGSSETGTLASAQAVAQRAVERLKSASPNISQKSTGQSESTVVTLPPSR